MIKRPQIAESIPISSEQYNLSFLNSDKLIVNINILGTCQFWEGRLKMAQMAMSQIMHIFWMPPELMIARSAWHQTGQPTCIRFRFPIQAIKYALTVSDILD